MIFLTICGTKGKAMHRFKEPSTWAGLALIFQGVAQAMATQGTDQTAWASIIGGVAAVAMKEAANK